MTSMRPHGPPSGGGKDAYAAFYRATAERTFRTVCRMTSGDRQLAWDVTQDAYLVMWDRWPRRQHRSHDDNRKFVQGIARRKVIDWYRANRRFVEPDEELAACSMEEDLVEKLDERAALAAVRELIESQPPRRRLVVVLYFIEETPYAEIAKALGITESTVRTQVERFMSLLKPLTSRFTDTNRGGERS